MKRRARRFAGCGPRAVLGVIIGGVVFPFSAGAQVSVSDVSVLSAQSTTGPWTFSFPVNSPLKNAALFVYVDTMRVDRTGLRVVLDNHQMSPVGTNPSVLVFVAVAPGSGTHTLKVSGLSTGDLLFGVLAAVFNGVDQSTPTGTNSTYGALTENCGACRGPLAGSAGPSPAGSAEAVFGYSYSPDVAGCSAFVSSDWPIRTGVSPWGNRSVTGMARSWIYSAAPPSAAYVALVGNPVLANARECPNSTFFVADLLIRPAPGFSATVRGHVTSSDAQPAAVTVTLGPGASTMVDAGGNYSFAGVDWTQPHTLTFQSDKYTFSPATLSLNYQAVYGGATASMPNVVATPVSTTSSSAPSSVSPRLSAAATSLWAQQPNPKLKGPVGALVVNLPPGAGNTLVRVRVPGAARDAFSAVGAQRRTFVPGSYDVTIGAATIHGVEIRSGNDTVLRVGALHVNADVRTTYEVVDESNRVVAKHFGNSVTALPVGTYQLKIGGSVKAVTIESGQVIDY